MANFPTSFTRLLRSRQRRKRERELASECVYGKEEEVVVVVGGEGDNEGGGAVPKHPLPSPF